MEKPRMVELPAIAPFGGQESAATTSSIACCPMLPSAYSFSPCISMRFIHVYNCSPSAMCLVVEQPASRVAANRYMIALFIVLAF